MAAVPEQWPRGWPDEWLGSNPSLYRPDQWKVARDIEVAALRQIFLYPLALRVCNKTLLDPKGVPQAVAEVLDDLQRSEDWQLVPDLRDHAGSAERDPRSRYEEFAYFHEFVQPVLFGERTPEAPAVRLFRRSRNPGPLTVPLASGRSVLSHVERCDLFLYDNGLALLVLETSTPSKIEFSDRQSRSAALTLADVLDYVASVQLSGPMQTHAPGERVSWGNLDIVPGDLDLGNPDAFVAKHRTTPVLRHWAAILSPLRIAGYGKAGEVDGATWTSAIETRIPIMTYVSLTKEGVDNKAALWSISRGIGTGCVTSMLRMIPHFRTRRVLCTISSAPHATIASFRPTPPSHLRAMSLPAIISPL
ncbi:hypothetical protein RHODGE_RHODGE_02086 [Rhodoplanes serenus]|uniref:Uncharacterized protein n=1 Tax=Rhodoplanes serenus TaxID=200615 RepID=A0A447CSL0_9BRAD|nr:hypothetical protein [Rhodoplanes serenus]VCU08227.1 hypothetical protein RHODGE_RHODGE_02086 [Rhodoplanes serenus]